VRRNPKPRFTDEQEAELSRTEAIMTRARIMERGVANLLNNGEYASAGDIEVCAIVLTESVNLRIECETQRAAIRKADREAHPRKTGLVGKPRRRGVKDLEDGA
jgi:hypothetical protein